MIGIDDKFLSFEDYYQSVIRKKKVVWVSGSGEADRGNY